MSIIPADPHGAAGDALKTIPKLLRFFRSADGSAWDYVRLSGNACAMLFALCQGLN